jgi:hypothetical protein
LDEDSEGGAHGGGGGGDAGDIEDETGTDVVNLRRTIYLTIMSSLDFEEAGHKLMKIQLRPGQVGLVGDRAVWRTCLLLCVLFGGGRKLLTAGGCVQN